MTQRRMPSGQGPARRPGQPPRPGGRTGSRVTSRDTAARGEPHAGAPRAGAPRTGVPRATPLRGTGVARGVEASRSGSRPPAARRAASGGATKRTVATRPRTFTGRATILLFVLVILALGYTYPVRLYLAQESQIGRMEADLAKQRAVIAGKAETVAKWQDDAYVRIQARKRLLYTDPGEVLLVVVNSSSGADQGAGREPGDRANPDRWYDTLFSSVAAANAEPRR